MPRDANAIVLRTATGLVVITLGAAVLAPVIAPYDPLAQDIIARLKGPTAAHWLGADQLGRDILSRLLHGSRTSLLVAGVAVASSLLIGGTLGLCAAWARGLTDRIIMRAMDVLLAFPVMLLAIAIVAVLGPGLWTAAVAIAIVYTPVFARVLRAPALVICESEYVMGARSIGASDLWIVSRHVLPNLMSVILVQTSLLISGAILVEAALSFLGLGAQAPYPSLGLMLSEGRNVLRLSPWAAIFSGAAILLLAFALNLLGDALRDRLDPRLQGRET